MGEEHSCAVSIHAEVVSAQTAEGEYVTSLVERVRQLERLVRLLEEDRLVLTREIARLRPAH
jgi:hypothetical protein